MMGSSRPSFPPHVRAAWLLGVVSVCSSTSSQTDGLHFTDVTGTLGIDFRHRHFGTGEKNMPENMGAGVAVFDANGDGELDLYFVQGAPWSQQQSAETPLEHRTNRLYQRQGERFEPVASGLEDGGYGMGVAVGDVDGDGRDDVFVTNYGPNQLYRNRGSGRFTRDDSFPQVDSWSASAAFFDADRDGDLDLYVVNYLDFTPANHRYCGSAARRIRSYCHPDVYGAAPDRFYRNDGQGRFVDETDVAGFADASFAAEGKGLGVYTGDLDQNGTIDVLVANDSTRNLLFFRSEDARGFRELGLLAGVGYSGAGRPEASMGVAAGDVDGDGRVDLLLTHLDQETNTLYRNLGTSFVDTTQQSGLAAPSLPFVGFGTQLFDADLDGDLDLFVTNGHIIDNIDAFDATRSHLQPAQLFLNDGAGRFAEDSSRLGLGERRFAGRGAVAADWDRDGDLDLVFTQNNGPAVLLENRLNSGRSLRLRFKSDLPAGSIDLRARWRPSDGTVAARRFSSRRVLPSTQSYLSQPPRELILAVDPRAGSGTVEVHWPNGPTSTHAVKHSRRSTAGILESASELEVDERREGAADHQHEGVGQQDQQQ